MADIYVWIIILAIICEFIDSSMGMLYGTLLSPILIIYGFDPIVTVPAILFSQAFGGFVASTFHHKYKNCDFSLKTTKIDIIKRKLHEIGCAESFRRGTTADFKIAFFVTATGILATIFSSLIAINISKDLVKTYIGILVTIMGMILLFKPVFKFSWRKMLFVSFLSAFNKGISGGGFGPVMTSGQVISGRNSRNSIGATTFAEAPICLVGFLVYLFLGKALDWNLVYFLTIGSVIGAPFGALFTAKFKEEKRLRTVLGVITFAIGVLMLTVKIKA
ncbi:MAG: sulfite exporter TauE/SafE family protein [Minisyncoccia bacterium]